MGVPTGANLGQAQGSITINTTQAQQAPAVMRGVAQGINQAMGTVNTSTNKAQLGINSLSTSVRGLGSALGVGFGAGSIAQIARLAVELEGIATAYDRQQVAARSLAGSQQNLNELLEAYQRATGGAIDKATALADVTRLQAIGFADNAEEIERFARSVRGISLATGQTQDYVTQQLQLAIANQSTMRLDQIGLGVSEVKRRVAELRAENRGLSQEMAYQQAVLGLAEQKFGELTNSAEAQATGVERLRKAWADLRLEMGQAIQGPVGEGAGVLAAAVDLVASRIGRAEQLMNEYEASWRSTRNMSRTSIGRVAPTRIGGDEDITARMGARADFAQGIADLRLRTNQQILEAERSHHQQRLNSEREYQQAVTREARDFAINRLRQEQDMLDSIADVQRDATRREERMAEDLARVISDRQSDTNERLAELDEDYQRDREKRARDYRDDLLDAAGRLDAKAVAEAQRNFRRQEQDAKEAHENRLEDERKNLAESIRESNEAHQRQLEDAREADAQRIADMQADFALRKQREDEDRALRLSDMAQDHADQLAEFDRANTERLAQIRRHAHDEQMALQERHDEAMVDAGTRDQELIDRVEKREKKLEEIYDAFWDHAIRKAAATLPVGHPARADIYEGRELPGFAAGGFVPRDMLARLHAGELVIPASQVAAGGMGGRSLSIGDVNVTVMGSNASASDIGQTVRYHLERMLEEIAA